MSKENVKVVRAVIDGWLASDPSTLDLIAEDVVYMNPPTIVDRQTYEGHAGVLQWVVDWRRGWTDYELEVVKAEDLGNRVLTVERNRATGKRSGLEVEMETYSLWTLRDGKVVRWEGFPGEREALEAAAEDRSTGPAAEID